MKSRLGSKQGRFKMNTKVYAHATGGNFFKVQTKGGQKRVI